MSIPMYCDVTKRHDFVFLFDVTNGNPNGDPDAGNLPRVDPETMHGLVTDVAVKRKIRDYIDMSFGQEPGYNIFIQNKGIPLNAFSKRADEVLTETEPSYAEKKKEKKDKHEVESMRRQWMCQNFYDIRTFGAVLTTGEYRSGQVRGPVQITFSRSIDPIIPLDISITRVAITKIEDLEMKDTTSTMGRKALVPYGLYRGFGFFSPHFAKDTGMTNEDLTRFWEALQHCWDLDHSANRGMLSLRGLYIFTHENPRGNAPSHTLFERIIVEGAKQPRAFTDYAVAANVTALPEGVTVTRLIG